MPLREENSINWGDVPAEWKNYFEQALAQVRDEEPGTCFTFSCDPMAGPGQAASTAGEHFAMCCVAQLLDQFAGCCADQCAECVLTCPPTNATSA